MRSFVFAGILLGALAVFSLITSGPNIPSGWEKSWPRTDFSSQLVPLSEIVSAGLPKDGIPPIEDPQFEAVGEMTAPIAPTEPVMSLEISSDARAYPLSVLIWHQVVNDTVGGVPVVVTYCPLCNSGVIFRRTVAGKVTSFGTTGKLRHSGFIMYDRATESWWQQFEGKALVGQHAGHELEQLPARLESLREFRERHPDGLVLVPTDSDFRPYGRNPYVGYDTSAMPFMYQGEYDGPGSPLMRVVTVEGREEAWSLDFLRRVGKVEVADLVIEWTPGQNSSLDTARIDEGRDVGTVTVHRLSEGKRVEAIYHVPFAFAFRAFNPDAPIRHVE